MTPNSSTPGSVDGLPATISASQPSITGLVPPSSLPFGERWIATYFEEVDRMNADGLVVWYTEGACFRFGNAEPMHGRAAIASMLREFYGSIRSMSHRKTGCWIDGESGVWEAEVTFVTTHGRTVTLPAVSILRTRDGLVHNFRMVMDAAPLFATA